MAARLSIATFNLKNLHLPGERIHADEDGLSLDEYKAKVAWSAAALRELDADVIGFQELWHPDALAEVFDVAGLDADYTLLADPSSAGHIATAMAVRKSHGVAGHEWIADFPERFALRTTGESSANTDYEMSVRIRQFSRPVLHATLQVAQGSDHHPLHVYVVHLKSKLPTQVKGLDGLIDGDKAALGSALSTVRRTAEATALRLVLNTQAEAAEPIAVVGDFNDGQLSNTTSIVSEEPGYRLFAASRTGFRSARGLYAAATLQQLRSLRDVCFTYIHEGVHEALDHVLVSQHFYDHADARIWSFRQMRILNDHLDSQSEAKSVPHSDHAPVVATFDHNPR